MRVNTRTRSVFSVLSTSISSDALRRLFGEDDALLDSVDGRSLRRDGDAGGIAQHCVGELGDFLRHRRREEQRLPLLRQHGDDLLDVVDEAHVEHAVGFVEHQHFDLVEAQRALMNQIEQAAGRRDQHFDAARKRAHLPLIGTPPIASAISSGRMWRP